MPVAVAFAVLLASVLLLLCLSLDGVGGGDAVLSAAPISTATASAPEVAVAVESSSPALIMLSSPPPALIPVPVASAADFALVWTLPFTLLLIEAAPAPLVAVALPVKKPLLIIVSSPLVVVVVFS